MSDDNATLTTVRLADVLGAWLPIATAPRDGTAILGWCVHDADPYHDGDRLTIYGAHTEGMSHVADGLAIVEWGGAFDDSTWESSGATLPDWRFPRGSEWGITANPTHWMPLPAPPQNRAADEIERDALKAEPAGEVVVTTDESGQIVAVTRQDDDGRILSVIAESEKAEQAEPVAWMRWEWSRTGANSLVFDKPEKLSLSEEARGVEYDPLYTHPPQREPLTDEQINKIVAGFNSNLSGFKGWSYLDVARAVERAHGITND